MKKILLTLFLSGSFVWLVNAETTCLDAFNAAWNEAWDIHDLDRYNCHVQGLEAPWKCDENAIYDLEDRQEAAVNTFVGCCSVDPTC